MSPNHACRPFVIVSRSFLVGLSIILAVPAKPQPAATTNTLVPVGALWRYLDDGSDQGAGWRAPRFDDSTWPEGFAQLGYGDGDEETELFSGSDLRNRYITYYFRKEFTVTDAVGYASLTLDVLRDDGVAVYLNGTEIWRDNLPAETIGYRTLALTNVAGVDEGRFFRTQRSGVQLVEGTNVLAVEVHQSRANSSDLSFDLELSGVYVPLAVARGPYLQQGGPTNIIIRWRTNRPTDSRVGYFNYEMSFEANDPASTTEHEIRLTDLSPDTSYFYNVGTSQQILAADDTFFRTAPLGSQPTRIWVIGDSGAASSFSRSVYDAYRNFSTYGYADVWLMLGDNAYPTGNDAQYQSAVFDMYPELLRKTVAWSTIGNHETYSGSPDGFPFLHIFNQPTQGECGGVPSGTEKYYSFDYGNIHFVCLDAMTSDRSSNGPMCAWLREDLAANAKDWLIAFWHHPPYSRGHHSSDHEIELIEMRENAVPILESYGVDLVLCGHSHCYERSFLIDGHYGHSETFRESMKKDPGSGRPDDTGPYRKATFGPGANQGTVYVVAGSSSQVSGGSLDHPVMFFGELALGSLVLDIDGPVLEAKFLRETGAIDDYFTITKGDFTQPLHLFSRVNFDGTVTFTWNTRPNFVYRLEYSRDLSEPAWNSEYVSGRSIGHPISITTGPYFEPGRTTAIFFRVREDSYE